DRGDDDPVGDEFLRLARENGLVYCPTLTVYRGYLRLAQAGGASQAPAIDDPNGCVDAETRAKIAQSVALPKREDSRIARQENGVHEAEEMMAANLKRVSDAGITVAMGTDAGNPLTLHGPSSYREMEAMQAAALTPMQVIVDATRGGAMAMGVERETGTLEKGKVADLLVVDADPTRDVANLRKIRLVVRGGVVHPIGQLHEAASR